MRARSHALWHEHPGTSYKAKPAGEEELASEAGRWTLTESLPLLVQRRMRGFSEAQYIRHKKLTNHGSQAKK